MSTTPRPVLTHAGLNCFDIERMKRFYTEVLGLVQSDAGRSRTLDRDFVFLSADPTKHHQVVLVSGRAKESPVSTVNQLSFHLESLDQLRAFWRRAKEWGAKGINPRCHGNAWSVYFDDPEGNNIELYVDTPWYVAQPHGYPFDLDQPNEAIVRETEAHCRADPTFLSVEDWQAKMRRALGQG